MLTAMLASRHSTEAMEGSVFIKKCEKEIILRVRLISSTKHFLPLLPASINIHHGFQSTKGPQHIKGLEQTNNRSKLL